MHTQQLTKQPTSGIGQQHAPSADTMFSASENIQPPFFRLPAELRNVIYEDILGDLGNTFSCFGGLTYVQHRRVGLLFVNRQIYRETHLLPYSLNSITAGPRTNFKEWMERRTQDQLHAISRLHFVFHSFFEERDSEVSSTLDTDLGYTPNNNLAMNSLVNQQLVFPKLTGLRNILIELRSYAVFVEDLMEQIEFLEEAKIQIKNLNPQANVIVELNCLGDNIRQADIPASSMTGLRILRFDRLCEGEGRSIYDVLRRNGLLEDIYFTQDRKDYLRYLWQEAATVQIRETLE